MSSHNQAVTLMSQIMYQSRPVSTTTMAQCRACHGESPGGMECARCLTEELGRVIANRGAALCWLESFLKVQRDEARVFICAKRVDASALE
ncbi:hypothetical protein D7U74_00715 [Stenotrophomonas maltophilia]|jgi:hypothetical protein|nr:hypothetical protein [Stenotrophomonas maltophilia]